ncbi:MAG: PAS domain S-box protein, partial [Gammaproteobacteria bacterium]|nr:PAS domain S-box protein [Gammaproteobacteria bacterium]
MKTLPVHRRLTYFVALVVVVVSAVISIATTLFEVTAKREEGLQAIEQSFRYLSTAPLPSIEQALWVGNQQQLQLQLEALLELPYIERLSVTNENGRTFASGEVRSVEVIERQYPLQYPFRNDSLSLGTLTATAGRDQLLAGLKHQAWRLFLFNLIELTIIATILIWLIRQLIGRPLEQLADYLQRVDLRSGENSPLQLKTHPFSHRQNELGIVEEAVNRMVDRWSLTHSELESQVESRTLSLTQEIATRRDLERDLRQQHQRLLAILEAIPVPLAINNSEQQITYLNPAFHNTFGYTREELPHLAQWWPLAYPDPEYRQWVSDNWQKRLEEAAQQQRPFEPMELTLHTKGGEARNIVASVASLGEQSDEHLVILHDITVLLRGRERFRRILDAMPVAIGAYNEQMEITYINPAFQRTFGYTLEDIPHMDIFWPLAFPDPTYRAWVFATWSERVRVAQQSQTPSVPLEVTMHTKDGNSREIIAAASSSLSQPVEHLATLYDITERKAMERRLERFSRNFEAFLDQTTDFVYFKDEKSRLLFCSQTLAAITGHGHWKEMIGKHDREIFPAETAAIYEEEERLIFTEGKPLLHRVDPYFDEAGEKGFVLTNKWPLQNESGAVIGVFGISRDITEQQRAAQALAESESKLRGLYELSQLGIALNTMDGRFLEFNPSFARLTGYSSEELLSIDHWTLTPEKYRPQEEEQLKLLTSTGHYGPYEKEYRCKNGTLIPVSLTGILLESEGAEQRIWSIVEDISSKKAYQEQLEYIAHYDTLTKLPNRLLLADRLQQSMRQASRRQQLLAVVYIDLDGFKEVNDTYGH